MVYGAVCIGFYSFCRIFSSRSHLDESIVDLDIECSTFDVDSEDIYMDVDSKDR